MGRYDRNGIFSKKDMDKIQAAHVAVIGSGGLGGYIIEMLARVGIGQMTIVDGDVFDETNLNRQILSTMNNLGQAKAMEAKKHMAAINPDVKVHAFHAYMEADNVSSLLANVDLVVDGLDSIGGRLILQSFCEEAQIPLVHGAIAGWYGQVTTIFPGDRTLDRLYKDASDRGLEDELGNPSFTPATIASIQVSEALKVITGKEEVLRKKILMIDLLDNEFHIIEME